MSVAQYTVRPKADLDLDDHAGYLDVEANLEVALRFLAAARENVCASCCVPHYGMAGSPEVRQAGTATRLSCDGLREYADTLTGHWLPGLIFCESFTVREIFKLYFTVAKKSNETNGRVMLQLIFLCANPCLS